MLYHNEYDDHEMDENEFEDELLYLSNEAASWAEAGIADGMSYYDAINMAWDWQRHEND